MGMGGGGGEGGGGREGRGKGGRGVKGGGGTEAQVCFLTSEGLRLVGWGRVGRGWV